MHVQTIKFTDQPRNNTDNFNTRSITSQDYKKPFLRGWAQNRGTSLEYYLANLSSANTS